MPFWLTLAVAARALAKTYGAKLFLVNVVETPPAAMEIDFAPLKQEMVIAAGTALNNLKEKLGLVCEHSVVEGPIAEAIHDEAVRRHADLIVTGRGHAQGSFSRLWSHLYPIIRQAPCPVLSV